MKIECAEDYRRALERADALRSSGAIAEIDAELAEVEAAIAAYEALPDEPDRSKGRPAPDPYGMGRGSR